MENEENSADADLIYVGEELIDLEESNNVNQNGNDNEYISFEHDPDDVREIDGCVNSEDEKRDFSDLIEHGDGDGGIKDENGHNKVENLMVVDEWDDDDLDQDEDDEGEENYDKDAINPEDMERAILNMPNMKNLMDDIGHLKQNRKVILSPISLSDFNNDLLQEVINWTNLEEMKIAYARNYQENNSFVGILMLHFNTSTSASSAVNHLKDFKDGVNIKLDTNSHRLMEDFLDNVRSKKRWTDNVAILKNLTNEVTVESIKELFPKVEDVVLHLDTSSTSRLSKEKESATNNNSSTTPSTTTATVSAAANQNSSDSTTGASAATTTTTNETDEATTTTTAAAGDGDAATEAANKLSEVDAAASNGASSANKILHTPKGFAYLIFSNEELMKSEVEAAAMKNMQLDGHPVMLLGYKTPVHSIPRSYLRLRERKVILKHLNKCQERLEAAKSESNAKIIKKLEERIEQCKALIDRDNKCRKDMDLKEYTLDELRGMRGLPFLSPKAFQKILIRFGIVKEKKKKSPSPVKPAASNTNNNDRNRSNVRTDGDRRNSGRGSYSGNNNNKRSPYVKSRRSPYNGGNNNRNKRSWGSSNNYSNSGRGQRNGSGSGGGGRNAPQSLLGSAANLVNPLSLLMQPNLGILGSGGVLNPSLLMQSANVGMLNSGAGLLGSPYSGLGGLSADESKNKLIRLDETGNFRPAGGSMGNNPRYDDRNRRSGGGGGDNRFRDGGGSSRKKSRSPGRSRGDYDRGLDDDSSSIPVNMLLNLSQILSQKMDQKRQQIERRGPHDRDYRMSQR